MVLMKILYTIWSKILLTAAQKRVSRSLLPYKDLYN